MVGGVTGKGGFLEDLFARCIPGEVGHRYKGHAIRKNLAQRFRRAAFDDSATDPWEAMFQAGVRNRPAGTSDLNPFWVFPIEGGAYIERHVPLLPMSRDVQHFEDLKRSLAAYRMVFGQPRQEDLLAFLMNRFQTVEETEAFVRQLRINLEPPDSDNDKSS